MEGRADATVTRSGGMTAGELLALAERGDEKKTLLHVEVPPGVASVAPADPEQKRTWERAVLEGGMVDWEAGNARFLMEKMNAIVITPHMFAEAMKSE
mmetsp:Transcript_16195/g.31685  ORF Transcript_16195/g.31685 Transcript_16195/m.31685 type:complete len:98 (-) Transcript_16195:71-364(-)